MVLLILSISKFNIKKKINPPVSENIQYNFFFNFLYQFIFCTNRTLDPDTHGRILKNCDAWESATVYNAICTYNAYKLYKYVHVPCMVKNKICGLIFILQAVGMFKAFFNATFIQRTLTAIIANYGQFVTYECGCMR